MTPFTIDTMTTQLLADPADLRAAFERGNALLIDAPFAPALLRSLMARAANAHFVGDDVERIGTREIEAPQRVGGTISLLLARPAFREWLERATGLTPLRAVAGRLAQTRANGQDALAWHDDMDGNFRLLGVVINLSDTPFSGGQFEMRHFGNAQPFLSHRHEQPGAMMLFAVGPELQHRVAQVTSGGPRRVYAGWFLSQPEHASSKF